MVDVINPKIQRAIPIVMLIALFVLNPVKGQSQDGRPIANAGLSRYAGADPIVLDGTGSYDPNDSGPLIYSWQQISGHTVVISDANTATPTVSGFTQTDEIQEYEFELIVSNGEYDSLPDTVRVVVVPDFGESNLTLQNDSFDRNKPTLIYFGGGNCVTGSGSWAYRAWTEKANIISFPNYGPDSDGGARTYYKCGDMIIVYLSSVAPDYKQPIQTSGYSTGGQPAIDVGIRLNMSYADVRYAVNRVTFFDATTYCRENYNESITTFLDSSVDGEQCWIDAYVSTLSGGSFQNYPPFHENVLNVWFSASGDWLWLHGLGYQWYGKSLEGSDMNQFNKGVVAGAYWSVIGPGKNIQLASTPDAQIYKFKWDGNASYGYMDFYDESNHPGRLPEPVTLVGPADNAIVDANGALFSCEVSENAMGYQLLFGPDPYRVMDYYIVSDTPSPPTELIISSPFEQTWWTVRVYDQYGSTIYADPILANFENLDPPFIENINTGQIYASVRHAVCDAQYGHEIVVSPGVYKGDIDFQGKKLTLRSTDPNDPTIVATTIIEGDVKKSVVTFSSGEDTSCTLDGFTISGGNMGIYCSGSSPKITNCIITENVNADMGAGIFIKDGSSPTIVNCIFSSNSASVMGGGLYVENSNPILINCTFAGNSATYFGGGIYCNGGSPVLTNCILWGDTPDEISMFIGTLSITYSNIQGGFPGEGNIDAEPLFADAANGDYHLLTSSPCIDAGDPNSEFTLEPEPNGGRINMGAYGGTPEASKSP